jgi:transglutaminase-like putative cysteine protease
MKALCLLALCLALVLCPKGVRATELIDKVNQLEGLGKFKAAAQMLVAGLKDKALPQSRHKELEFELDRLDRIKKDFALSKADLYGELEKSVADLTAAEFEQWIHEGRFDSREIDGERFFMDASLSNLFFRYPQLSARRRPPKDSSELEHRIWETCVAIKAAARSTRKPYVLPKRFHVSMEVTAQSNAAPPGALIRAWLPVPRQYPFQGDFKLSSVNAAMKHLDSESSPIRSIYLEQPAVKGKPTRFTLQYDYTTHGVWFDLKPEQVGPWPVGDPGLERFTCEAPHTLFTPTMRRLSDEIVGVESNPCVKAKKLYDWIADHIQYSYALEYSTIRNISEDCRARGYGDCGQEGLLFITLCRLNGIPARWQSGWNTFPGATTIHDWTEIYLAPYGWVPVDPYMGVFAMRYANTLTSEQKREVRDFYFGGLDQYRMAANSDHNQTLNPPKQSMRSDDVDFQRGELEWGEHNIYFDHYTWKLNWQELPLQQSIP